ncbi:beta-1,4-galactosyltransferase galt-1-like [Limulus polyphemus]|uniref:Glycosyltransferase family 92 protein n=1 Tax=Limulus polyphemus TaxID=6850 RepID=A0ABM1BAU3_LIMPO|nr:beta-1,4-galactosyltransferase galt-1-like [Limulus polyphemus]
MITVGFYAFLSPNKLHALWKTDYVRPIGLKITKDPENNQKDDWIKLTKNIHVYSAFWDDRLKPFKRFVRVVAVAPRVGLNQRNISCVAYNQSRNDSIVIPTSYEVIEEHHFQKYSAVYFICHWPRKRRPPTFINLRHNPTSVESRKLSVHIGHKNNFSETQNKMAACARPFFGPFNDTLALAEFVAVYSIIGVNHFTFYNYQISNETKLFISSLQKQGLQIELLPWSLPKSVITKTWAFGQLASTQDCIYRNMFDYKYVVLVDMDEFIFPQNHRTLQEMITSLPTKNWSNLVFQNSFFCNQHPEDPLYSDTDMPLRTLKHVIRERKIWSPYVRSKLIVQPSKIITCGIHFVWRHFKAWNSFMVSPQVSILHHYRPALCTKDHSKLIVDKHALKFKNQLLKSKVLRIWRELLLPSNKR